MMAKEEMSRHEFEKLIEYDYGNEFLNYGKNVAYSVHCIKDGSFLGL